ncbi:MAG: ABC transporter ATP-binding protein [Chloroflexota bacterium]|nr:ABC transporter ATP-binding protein [Chloroflexota bacterium]
MIEVEHLTKYYGAFPALRDVNFNVERGEILGFLGPNGAGKTTTMRIITGYIPATEGKVRVGGFDVAEKSLQARSHLGYLPETVPLYTELTPMEYLDFKGRISGMHNGRERKARILEIMDELNLTDVSRKLIGNLSRGYRQRVGLAQALLHNPDALILDEPTVGLDPVQITEVRDLIKRLGVDRTIILSTHLLPEVSMVCNRVIIINRGKLVALDTPFHLTEGANDAHTVQIEAIGDSEGILGVLRAVPGVTQVTSTVPAAGQVNYGSVEGTASRISIGEEALPSGGKLYQVEVRPGTDLRSQLAAAIIGGGYSLLELKSVRPSLEEIFIRVITQEEDHAGDDMDPIVDNSVGSPPADGAGSGRRRVTAVTEGDPASTPSRIQTKRRVRQ